MRSRRVWIVALVAACGGDDAGGDVPLVDAEVTDGVGPDGNAVSTRAMAITVSDVRLTSLGAVNRGVRGGVIAIDFEDLTQSGGEVAYGTSPFSDGCVVIRYDAAHPPRPTVDAGAITIANPAIQESGLRKTVGPCVFEGGVYRCVSHRGTQQITGSSSNITPFRTYEFAGTPFTDTDVVGSHILVNGFADPGLNTGDTPLPIVRQEANTLTVLFSAVDTSPVNDDVATSGEFEILNGLGPVPTQVGFAVDADFLGTEANTLRISKGADDDWGSLDLDVYTRGEGMSLADDSAEPHEFPSTAGDVAFSCDPAANGSCGADADAPVGIEEALVVSGRTTDVDISGTDDYEMPPPNAASQYAAFTCVFPDAVSGIIPSDAVAAILATEPTRIETRVMVVAGARTQVGEQGADSGAVVVGHGLVGHTTFP